ncbi:MAG: GNAT family N-acetyltransferase [Candidatus Eremiobacteraeota bacterium]|nr:GNAT family N-acetyltransferase [Candidatus Eremiobacteraeota bacterium]
MKRQKKTEIVIRRAGIKDVPAIVELAVEGIKFSLSPFRYATVEEVMEYRRKDLAVLPEIISRPNVGIFLAEDKKGDIIGCIMAVGEQIESSTGEEQGWIYDMTVRPEYWNQGIGTLLIETAEDFIRSLGHKYIGLAVTTANKRAVSFYKKRGYMEERKRMIKQLGDSKNEK